MVCKEALALSIWERQVVQPAAYEVLGQGVVGLEHYGTYSCRRQYGKTAGPVSEHATADAIDLGRLHAGRRPDASMSARDWNDPGPGGQCRAGCATEPAGCSSPPSAPTSTPSTTTTSTWTCTAGTSARLVIPLPCWERVASRSEVG